MYNNEYPGKRGGHKLLLVVGPQLCLSTFARRKCGTTVRKSTYTDMILLLASTPTTFTSRQRLLVDVVGVDANVDATLTTSSTSEDEFTTTNPSTIQTQYHKHKILIALDMVSKDYLKTCLCVMLTNIEGGRHGGGGGRMRKFE